MHERLDHHLKGWQNKLLSKAGKAVLIKAVAQAIPTFTMSVFMLPKGVCRMYQSKVAKYWWGNSGGKRGIHWSTWEVLCKHKNDGGLGFRDIGCFNQAILAKTVWRLILNPELLACKILYAKYFAGSSWAEVRMGAKPSFIWKSLLWGRDLICSGTRWRIGSGEAVGIWTDKWLPSPWSFQIITPAFLPRDTRVKRLMLQPEKILSIPLSSRAVGDVVIWHYTKTGHYTVKSGYWLGMEWKQMKLGAGSSGRMGVSNSNSLWSKIWSLQVPSKVKLLLWRACHSFLPCVERLVKRRICSQSVCARCGEADETVIHCLWECRVVRKIWKLSWMWPVYKIWKEPSFMDLFAHVLASEQAEQVELFGLLIWWIWKDRNNFIHRQTSLDPSELLRKCSDWQRELKQVWEKKQAHKHNVRSKNQLEVKWERPPPQWCKLNFDGACEANGGNSGLGAVIRNELGELVGALAVPFAATLKPSAVEALALQEGLRYSRLLGIRNLEVEGDALCIINSLSQTENDLTEIGAVLEGVRLLLQEFEFVNWKHVRKKANQVAHELARSALKSVQSMFCRERGPPWLSELVEATNDVRG
ncbi:putative ribonuclease H-like domain, reverse transcriptase zinc-binding domain-containing protein [Rosa chinensis]|uniref:Putative ribonuclease H-like domain, reverse transcriptase zinc-binding domain-containing protein n=1 Tax=Rosa chinensis TaxID=74649 RepID=A0A2P6QT88_ROSCH|nr:putative ribonuclease H-like domain, reverse transcriptase zinc-binding domain-containing protein [Rosa chinensis]